MTGVIPEFDATARKLGIAFAVQQALERGVTTIHDMVKDPGAVRAYQELRAEGGLHMRASLLLRVIESEISTDSVLETGLQSGFSDEWLRAGVKMAGGSDSPGYWPADPLRDIGAYVSRRMLWGEVLVPEEALSVQQAFELHTTRAAFAGFEEHLKGTLEAGKLADMAVLAEDPFEAPAERIKDIKVEMTVVGGEIKYQA